MASGRPAAGESKAARHLPLKVAGGYLLASSLYILFSDRLASALLPPAALSAVQSVKGLGFVLLSSVILYTVLHAAGQAVERRSRQQAQLLQLQQHLLAAADSLARVTTELQAYATACQFLTDVLHYPLAWVAQAYEGEEELLPVAAAGPAGRFVEGITARHDESALGQGPVGTAFRTGKT